MSGLVVVNTRAHTTWLPHIGALVLLTVLTLTRAPAIVFHPASVVTPDLIDPVFYIWSVSSAIHQVASWHNGFWSLFDANVYWPTPHGASYTDVTVGLLPLSIPLHLLIHNPVALLNALTTLAFVLSGYGAFVLAHMLTRSYWAGLVAGLMFSLCPFRTEHLGHINILSTEWLTGSAICLVWAWRDPRMCKWALAGLLIGLSAISNLYYLAYLAGPALLTALLLGRCWTRERIAGAIAALVIASLFIAPFIIPYATRHAAYGPGYGAASGTDILSFLQVLPGRPLDSALLPNVPLEMMQPAHGFFPGIIPLFLVLMACWNRRARLWIAFTLACGVLALGPSLQIHGHILPIPLPYAALARLVPFFSLFRDPPRAMIGVSLGLAILSAWGLRDLLAKIPHPASRMACGAVVAGLIALELWSPVPTRTLGAIPRGERWLARQPRIHVVLELPIDNRTPADWQRQSEIMYDSTAHWKMLVNGSSSVEPVGMAERRKVLATYPSPASLRMLHSLRVDAVILRLDWLTPRQRAAMQAHCDVGYHDALETICLQDHADHTLARGVLKRTLTTLASRDRAARRTRRGEADAGQPPSSP